MPAQQTGLVLVDEWSVVHVNVVRKQIRRPAYVRDSLPQFQAPGLLHLSRRHEHNIPRRGTALPTAAHGLIADGRSMPSTRRGIGCGGRAHRWQLADAPCDGLSRDPCDELPRGAVQVRAGQTIPALDVA